jgi:ATP-dependent RNA helicase DeaD
MKNAVLETPKEKEIILEKPSVEAPTFADFKLSAGVSRALTEMGFTSPTPIQSDALPLLLGEPTDFIGLAATGTGKTAAFGIPLIEKINSSLMSTQALILCPTRELALQVCGQILKLGKNKGIRAITVYGGASYNDQIYGIKKGAHVIVATPGRLVDLLERGNVKLNHVKTVVLDEADEMISMGFKEDMDTILNAVHDPSRTDARSNTWLFSATMSADIRKIAHRHLVEPKQIQINKKEVLSGTVEQIFYVTQEKNKADVLCKIIDHAENFYGLIFCQTKLLVSDIAALLKDRGYQVDCLHGDLSQSQRERILSLFRNKKLTILVCTDVAARGLDVKDLTHVVNYSIPRELDSYVHRIGRTARSGKAGYAISLVSPSFMGIISRIERMTSSKMKQGIIPTRKDVGTKKLTQYLDKFKMALGHERAAALLDQEWLRTLEAMPKAEIAARFLALSYQDLFIEKPEPKMIQERVSDRGPRRDDRNGPPRGARGSFHGGNRGDGRRFPSRGRSTNHAGRPHAKD